MARLDGAIEFWNTGAERLYGFASDVAHLISVLDWISAGTTEAASVR
jgi:hypothetical protein